MFSPLLFTVELSFARWGTCRSTLRRRVWLKRRGIVWCVSSWWLAFPDRTITEVWHASSRPSWNRVRGHKTDKCAIYRWGANKGQIHEVKTAVLIIHTYGLWSTIQSEISFVTTFFKIFFYSKSFKNDNGADDCLFFCLGWSIKASERRRNYHIIYCSSLYSWLRWICKCSDMQTFQPHAN